MDKKNQYNLGDKIQYNHAFLKNTGCILTEFCDFIGVITEIKIVNKKVFYRVIWNNENESHLLFSGNVCRVGRDSTE